MGMCDKANLTVTICDGCERHCRLGYQEYCGMFFPSYTNETICTKIIEYIDNNGIRHNMKTGLATWEKAVEKARDFAQQCSRYKAR